MMRIEVWFADGLFRAFPNVKKDTYKVSDSGAFIMFEFGGGHIAKINLKKVNFMEEMEE